jgi:hypothetical protein
MRLLSAAGTCRMGAFRTHKLQRKASARPVRAHALLNLNATFFPNTEAVVRSERKR